MSLIEASMVLALSAVVVAGAVAFYGTASDNSKLQRAQQQLAAIQSAVASLYANQSDYTGVSVEILKDSKALPDSYFNSDKKLLNPWQGDITVQADKSPSRGYSLTSSGVPPSACVKLLTGDPGTLVNTVKVGQNEPQKMPLSVETANTQCGNDGSVSITYAMF
ncbi:type 4 pilus major pilin [Chromobacterium amazonense]|uniref:type 4 pilus major pilin n=1 Tax=Chromobacterium amazonense TaxID=1382803 RepID=UPI003F7A025F